MYTWKVLHNQVLAWWVTTCICKSFLLWPRSDFESARHSLRPQTTPAELNHILENCMHCQDLLWQGIYIFSTKLFQNDWMDWCNPNCLLVFGIVISSVLVNQFSPLRSAHLYADWCANRIVCSGCWFVPERGHECELALPGKKKTQSMIEKKKKNKYIKSPPWKRVNIRDKKIMFKKFEGKAWCHHVVYLLTLWSPSNLISG